MKTPILNEKQEWQMPVLEVIASETTEGDPTISDDGLGDGLFS